MCSFPIDIYQLFFANHLTYNIFWKWIYVKDLYITNIENCRIALFLIDYQRLKIHFTQSFYRFITLIIFFLTQLVHAAYFNTSSR